VKANTEDGRGKIKRLTAAGTIHGKFVIRRLVTSKRSLEYQMSMSEGGEICSNFKRILRKFNDSQILEYIHRKK